MKKIKFHSIVSLANAKMSVQASAIILAGSTFLSAILGIVRDRLLTTYYLNTYPTGLDAYTAAFTIPDFMFLLLTSGALAVSFIPVFNQRLASGNKKSAWELSSSIINLFATITLIASILIMIFADPLIRYIVSPGLDESGMVLAINMTRIIAINPFLFSISTVLTSVQQAVSRFVFYAFAPALYNIGIIIGITSFTNGINIFGLQIFDGGIVGVALGVVFGSLLQLIVSFIGLFGLGVDYEFKIYWRNQGFRSLLKLLPARSLDQGIDYINSIVNTNLSSRMSAGTLRSFTQASSLASMPVNLIGVAISTAFFPQFTKEIGEGNEDKFRDTFRTALKTILWIALPVAAIAFFARGYVVTFVSSFKPGTDVNSLIVSILGSLTILIFARSVFHVMSRGFYAYQDTKTPFIISIIAVGSTMLLSVLFYKLGFGAVGLGYSQSIGAIFEITLLLITLQKKSKNKLINKAFWQSVLKMIVATAIAGAVAYSMVKFIPLMATDTSIFVTLPKFFIITIISLTAYIAASYFLGLEEAEPIINWIKKVVFRNAK